METTTEDTGTRWNIIRNSIEQDGNWQKLLVSYMAWAWLTPTLTHVIMCDPVTSGAKDEQCHLGCLFEGKLECLMHAIDEV